MNATDTPVRGGGLAVAVVRLTGAWILAGALGKLFLGTPKLLPPVVIDLVKEHTSWSLTFTFQFVIAAEIVIAGLAFLKPRYAWPVVLGMMAFFDWILQQTIAGGEKSCGCFGGSIDVSPWFMLTVDSLLLVALVATMPWKRITKRGAPWWWMLIVLAIAVLAPWLKINASIGEGGPKAPAIVETGGTLSPPNGGTLGPPNDGTLGPPDGGALSGPNGKPPTPVAKPAPVAKVDWVEFDPKTWVDQLVYDLTDLSSWGIDVGLLPSDGKILLWRRSCDHCAEHLSAMAQNDPGDTPIVMIQIQDDLKNAEVVALKPQGPHVTELQFPEGLEFLLQTPWEIVVEGGMVTQALDPEELEEGR